MAFEPGKSGNPNGRPKGSLNKTSSELREKITLFLNENFENVQKEFESLQGRDKVKMYTDLLPYGTPKLQNMSLNPDFDSMSEEQLDQIINALLERQNG
jgi:hypothetical protein